MNINPAISHQVIPSPSTAENQIKILQNQVKNLQSQIMDESQSNEDEEIKQQRIEALQAQIQQYLNRIAQIQAQELKKQMDSQAAQVQKASLPQNRYSNHMVDIIA